jgi:hypothetical protein
MPTVASSVTSEQGPSTRSLFSFYSISISGFGCVCFRPIDWQANCSTKRRLLVRPMVANHLKAGLICLCAFGISNNSVAQRSGTAIKNIFTSTRRLGRRLQHLGDKLVESLELLIAPGDRIALEGDNQKQTDL